MLSTFLSFLSLLVSGSELDRTGESGMKPSSCSGDEASLGSDLKTTPAVNNWELKLDCCHKKGNHKHRVRKKVRFHEWKNGVIETGSVRVFSQYLT